jgi:hypothetical protein
MQIYYQRIETLPDYVAWVQCNPEDRSQVEEMFPKDKYELLIAIQPNYDPITCSQQVLYNPPAPTWGLDVWKKEDDGRYTELSTRENPQR